MPKVAPPRAYRPTTPRSITRSVCATHGPTSIGYTPFQNSVPQDHFLLREDVDRPLRSDLVRHPSPRTIIR